MAIHVRLTWRTPLLTPRQIVGVWKVQVHGLWASPGHQATLHLPPSLDHFSPGFLDYILSLPSSNFSLPFRIIFLCHLNPGVHQGFFLRALFVLCTFQDAIHALASKYHPKAVDSQMYISIHGIWQNNGPPRMSAS